MSTAATIAPAPAATSRVVTREEAVCVAFCSLFMALMYQKGAGWPITDMFPLIERLLNPAFLPHDFYTNTLESYSGRHYVARMFALAATWLETDYRLVVGWSNLPRLFLTGIFSYCALRALCAHRPAALVATFLGCASFFALPVFVGYYFIDNYNTGHSISLMLMLPAWAYALCNRPAPALPLLAAAILMHPVNGLHGLGLAVILHAGRYGPAATLAHLRQPAVLPGCLLVAGSILAHYLPHRAALDGFSLPAAEFVHIIGAVRHPHHYLPSRFDPDLWLVFTGFVITGAYMAWRAALPKTVSGPVWWTAVYALSWMLAGYVFVEALPVKSITTLQPFRVLIIFPVLFVAILAHYLLALYRRRAWLALLLLVLPFAPVQAYWAGWNWLLIDPLTLPRIVTFFVGFLVSMLTWHRPGKPGRQEHPQAKVPLATCLAIFSLPLLLWGVHEFRPDRVLSIPQERVYRVVPRIVPPEAVILADPIVASNEHLRLYSRRAIAASRDFPFNERHFRAWAERFLTAYGSIDNYHRIDALDDAALDAVADRLGAEYVIRDRPLRDENRLLLLQAVPGAGRFGRDIYIYHNELPAHAGDSGTTDP